MQEPFTASFLNRLQHLRIRTRRSFLGLRQGSHQSLRRGHGLEFSDHRPYTLGDDFRHIDWRVAARTDRVYVRQFREEQDMHVSVLLDGSKSMAISAEGEKQALARNLALAMGYVALSDGDPVTYSILGHGNSPHYVSPRAIGQVVAYLDSVPPAREISFAEEVRKAVAYSRLPGKCFVISDFLFSIDEAVRGLDILRARNFEIVVLQVLSRDEEELSLAGDELAVDAKTGEEFELSLDASSRRDYHRALRAHLADLERYCVRTSITYGLFVAGKETFSDVVFQSLPKLGILT